MSNTAAPADDFIMVPAAAPAVPAQAAPQAPPAPVAAAPAVPAPDASMPPPPPVASAPPASAAPVASTDVAATDAAAADLQGVSVRATAEYNQMKLVEGTMMGMLDIAAGALEATDTSSGRAPVEVCAVIDRSGSMGDGKLALVLKALEFIVRELTHEDKLCVVTYDHVVSTAMPLTVMTAAKKEEATRLIKAIRTGGTTNLSGGLLSGLDVFAGAAAAEAGGAAKTKKAVWLFTDGHANVGLTTTDPIVTAVHEKMPEDGRVSISTFGFGKQHNDEMLRAVAEAGDGLYYFIETQDQIAECFAECLGGLLTVVASDVAVTFTPAPGAEVLRVPESTSAKVEGGVVTVRYPDLYAEETRTVLVELRLLSAAAGEQTLGHVSLSYISGTGVSERKETVLAIARVAEYTADRERDVEVAAHTNRIAALRTMEEAKAAADAGRYEEARCMFGAMKQQTAALNVSDAMAFAYTEDQVKQAPVDKRAKMMSKMKSKAMAAELECQMDQMCEQTTAQTWGHTGRKACNALNMAHMKQQSQPQVSAMSSMPAAAMQQEQCAYTTTGQANMMNKMKSFFGQSKK